MPCMCGDIYCRSCGPAQGNHYCSNCGEWQDEHGEPGSEHDNERCAAAVAEVDAAMAVEYEEDERLASEYWARERGMTDV